MPQRSRTTLFVVVLLIHVAVVVGLLGSAQRATVPHEGTAIQVTIAEAAPVAPAEPVAIEVEWRAPQIVVPAPEVMITLPTESPLLAAPSPVSTAAPPPQAIGDTPRMATPADYLRPPVPHYPVQARQARQQGTVVLLVSIDTQGKPVQVDIERSSGLPLLDRAAIAAVRAALFRPLSESGVARAVRVLVPIEFSLNARLASS